MTHSTGASKPLLQCLALSVLERQVNIMMNEIKLSIYSHGDEEIWIPVTKSGIKDGKIIAARAFLPLKGTTRNVYTYGDKSDSIEANATDYFSALVGFQKGRINGQNPLYSILGLNNEYRGLSPSCGWVRVPVNQLGKVKAKDLAEIIEKSGVDVEYKFTPPIRKKIFRLAVRKNGKVASNDSEDTTASSEASKTSKLTGEERKAVEMRAMEVVQKEYEEKGWNVFDVSSANLLFYGTPYDLHVTKNRTPTTADGDKHIEVKGTTGPGYSIELTVNEVDHVRSHSTLSVLAVVHNIRLSRDSDEYVASGGKLKIYDPWEIDEQKLKPKSYSINLKD